MKKKERDSLDIYVGEIIKQRRIELKYTQQQVADYLGVSDVTVLNYETGESGMNRTTTIKICAFLRLDYVDLSEKVLNRYLKENK